MRDTSRSLLPKLTCERRRQILDQIHATRHISFCFFVKSVCLWCISTWYSFTVKAFHTEYAALYSYLIPVMVKGTRKRRPVLWTRQILWSLDCLRMFQTFVGRYCTDTTDRLWKLLVSRKRLESRNNGGSTIINYPIYTFSGQQFKSNQRKTESFETSKIH